MKTIIKNTAATLGYELMDLFMDMCGNDINFLQDITEEALHALNVARTDKDWDDITLLDYEDFEEIIYQF